MDEIRYVSMKAMESVLCWLKFPAVFLIVEVDLSIIVKLNLKEPKLGIFLSGNTPVYPNFSATIKRNEKL